MRISIYNIDHDTYDNPRGDVAQKDVSELQQSIISVYQESSGARRLLEPVGVEPHPEQENIYTLLYGWRRYWALRWLHESDEKQYAWAEEIEVEVDTHAFERSGRGAELYALIENIQREDMPAIKEALAIKKLLKREGQQAMTQTEVATLLGKSEGWISQRLKLLELAPPVLQALEEGNISFGVARELNRVEDEDMQREIAEEAAEKKLRVSDVKDEIDRRTRPASNDEPGDDKEGPAQQTLAELPSPSSRPSPSFSAPRHTLLVEHVHELGVLIPGMSARSSAASLIDQAFHAGILVGLTQPGEGVIAPFSRAEMTKAIEDVSKTAEENDV